jgi:hypothetical protein
VSLFIEQDDEIRLKVDEERNSDDVFLARLNLDHLGIGNRALIKFGDLLHAIRFHRPRICVDRNELLRCLICSLW